MAPRAHFGSENESLKGLNKAFFIPPDEHACMRVCACGCVHVVVVVDDIFYLQHMILYRKYVIKQEQQKVLV